MMMENTTAENTTAALQRTGRSEPHEDHASISTARIPGELGIWIFIFGDLAVFGLLFGMFAVYRIRQPEVFARSQQTMLPDIGFANTIILLASSLFVVIGIRAMKHGMPAVRPLLAAIVCGTVFAVLKVIEWSVEVAGGKTPYTDDFYQMYYILTGLHLVHVIVGIGVLSYLVRMSRRPAMRRSQFGVAESGACFWHMVDLLWVMIFPLVYLLG